MTIQTFSNQNSAPSALALAPIIELVGPAGVGKTTLLKALGKQRDDLSLDTPVYKTDYLRFFLFQGWWLLPVLLTHLSPNQRLRWEEIRSMAYLETWYYRLVTQRSPHPPISILDHGPMFRLAKLQAFGSLATRKPAYQRWWQGCLQRWLEALDVIVLLDAPDSVLLERVLNRADWHLLKDTDSLAAQKTFFVRYRRIYDQLLRATVGFPKLKVVQFDTSRHAASEIATALLSQLSLSPTSA